jgi:hypothetical protein
MRILIACEFSGRVRDAFRAKGHHAMSYDLLPSEAPGPHMIGDVTEALQDEWDMMIAFPPCTWLCTVGAGILRWDDSYAQEQRKALDFVRTLLYAPIPKIALENPVGAISTYIYPPDQIVQPWWFGDPYTKKTCLWLKNLPKLQPSDNWCRTGRQSWVMTGTKDAKRRSRTFPGLAKAMADQWG